MEKFNEIIKENKEKSIVIILVILALILSSFFAVKVVNANNKMANVANTYISMNEIVDNSIDEINFQENTEIMDYTIYDDFIGPLCISEEIEEEEEIKEEEKVTTTVIKPKYYIKVNYGAQVVTIYKMDSDGKYTIPVKAMLCSTGEYTPVSGVYGTTAKYRWLPLQGSVYGQYSTRIVGSILFHSVPYIENGNAGSLQYWKYDKLGLDVSAGCVRLTVANAKWIYDNCSIGTQVEFYSSSNPGPLGKPTEAKISDAEGDLKNWDPTDPASNNPWHSYVPETTTPEVEEEPEIEVKPEVEPEVEPEIEVEPDVETEPEVEEPEVEVKPEEENQEEEEDKNVIENTIE